MATIDEFALKNIGLWWRYGISRHCDEWKYIIIGWIFESEIIIIPPSLKISESSSNGSYRNTDEVWWRYGISRSCDECGPYLKKERIFVIWRRPIVRNLRRSLSVTILRSIFMTYPSNNVLQIFNGNLQNSCSLNICINAA
jgi:hypothetical protein